MFLLIEEQNCGKALQPSQIRRPCSFKKTFGNNWHSFSLSSQFLCHFPSVFNIGERVLKFDLINNFPLCSFLLIVISVFVGVPLENQLMLGNGDPP